MRAEEDDEVIIFKFSPIRSLKIHKKEKVVEWRGEKIKFDKIIGYWKNFRTLRRKNVYYVMLLTSKRMIPITPLLDEYDADEILSYLKRVIPREAKR